MKYTVVWRPSAEQQLAHLWNEATDRAAVTMAANRLDAWLRRTPATQGESRGGVTRILVEEPLVVLFDVEEQDCLVTVWAVWRSSPAP